jgi:hypothetical protein
MDEIDRIKSENIKLQVLNSDTNSVRELYQVKSQEADNLRREIDNKRLEQAKLNLRLNDLNSSEIQTRKQIDLQRLKNSIVEKEKHQEINLRESLNQSNIETISRV